MIIRNLKNLAPKYDCVGNAISVGYIAGRIGSASWPSSTTNNSSSIGSCSGTAAAENQMLKQKVKNIRYSVACAYNCCVARLATVSENQIGHGCPI